MTKPVCWSTQGGDFNNNHTNTVEIILTELYATKV